MCTARKTWAVGLCVLVWLVSALTANVRADGVSDLKEQLRQLQEQNSQLQQQLLKQQQTIDNLSRRLSDVEGANQKRGEEIGSLKAQADQQAPASTEAAKSLSTGKLILSGEGGVAFFQSGRDGAFPQPEFRVDEARLFLDANPWDDTYLFAQLDLFTREQFDENVHLAELYIDFEDVSRLWNLDRLLSIRVGRMDIPFGEEYQHRYAIDNPLIAHSLSDIWGMDDGVELYGKAGKVDYALAVQNGGASSLQDFTADKSVIGRVGYEPVKWLRVSASAMRTGELSVQGDGASALWFGNSLIEETGPTNTTSTFRADLVEGDVQLRLPHGHVNAAGGCLRYTDNNTAANDHRNVYYYYVEGVQDITAKLYGAARFSQIIAPGGFPVVANGDYDDYSQSPAKNLWRLTMGAGYRFNANLVLKVDYSLERGEDVNGEPRDHEDLFASEVAFQF